MAEMPYGQKARWQLPETVNPEGRRCIKIQVPDDPNHIAAFRGALASLASAYNWQNDGAHTARDVALVWREIVDSSLEWGCDMTQLRQDDLCTLAWSYDDWATFDTFDPSACITAYIDSVVPGMIQQAILDAIQNGTIPRDGAQPGPSPALDPGGCKTFHVALLAEGQWISPIRVSTGDTVHITNMTGGWNDGAVTWYCPDGNAYGLGICTPNSGHTEAGDPLPTANHMSIVGKLGSTWFQASDVYVVPSGHTNELLIIQANDSALGDNTGSAQFDIEICASVWCYEWDFTQASGGWTINVGSYIASTGYRTALFHVGNEYYRYVDIQRDLTQSTIISADLWYDLSAGAGSRYVDFRQQGSLPSNIIQRFSNEPAGANQQLSFSGSKIVTRFQVAFVAGFSTQGDPGGTGTLKKIRIRGTGTNPFGASNC